MFLWLIKQCLFIAHSYEIARVPMSTRHLFADLVTLVVGENEDQLHS